MKSATSRIGRGIYTKKLIQRRSLTKARGWVSSFVESYNQEHLDSAIKFVTPEQCYKKLGKEIFNQRHLVYREAKRRNLHRWAKATINQKMINEFLLNPEKCKNQVKLEVAV